MADPPVAGVGLSLGYAGERMADLGAGLDRMARLGLNSVELFLPSLAVVVGGRVRRAALAELRAACADRTFALTLHGPLSADLGAPEAPAIQCDAARAGLEVAAEIGARVYVQHATMAQGPDAFARARAAEIEALARLAPEAAAAGCVIAVETMFARAGEWTATPAELAETLRAVAAPSVAATVDFSHSALNCAIRGTALLTELAALAPFARHLHVHDSFGRPALFRPWSRGDAIAFGFGDLHLPPGAGGLPWDAFAALPWGGPALANLELDARWEDEWPEAIRWTRAWAASTARPLPARGAAGL